jgi:hypothetical protein
MPLQSRMHNAISTRSSPDTRFTVALKSKEVHRQYPPSIKEKILVDIASKRSELRV